MVIKKLDRDRTTTVVYVLRVLIPYKSCHQNMLPMARNMLSIR